MHSEERCRRLTGMDGIRGDEFCQHRKNTTETCLDVSHRHLHCIAVAGPTLLEGARDEVHGKDDDDEQAQDLGETGGRNVVDAKSE
jgi:hypothetical protein